MQGVAVERDQRARLDHAGVRQAEHAQARQAARHKRLDGGVAEGRVIDVVEGQHRAAGQQRLVDPLVALLFAAGLAGDGTEGVAGEFAAFPVFPTEAIAVCWKRTHYSLSSSAIRTVTLVSLLVFKRQKTPAPGPAAHDEIRMNDA